MDFIFASAMIKGARLVERGISSTSSSSSSSSDGRDHPKSKQAISIRPLSDRKKSRSRRMDPDNLNMSFAPNIIFSPSHSSSDLDSTVQSMDTEDQDMEGENEHIPKSIFSKSPN